LEQAHNSNLDTKEKSKTRDRQPDAMQLQSPDRDAVAVKEPDRFISMHICMYIYLFMAPGQKDALPMPGTLRDDRSARFQLPSEKYQVASNRIGSLINQGDNWTVNRLIFFIFFLPGRAQLQSYRATNRA